MAWLTRTALILGLLSAGWPQDHTLGNVQIDITLSQNGVSINETSPVSGVVTADVQIRNGSGMGAQVYANFVGYRSEHHLTQDFVSLQVAIDTSRYFDGEQALIVHVHAHPNPNEPIDSSAFFFAKRVFLTNNGRPAPNGDTRLPQLAFRQIIVDDIRNVLTIDAGLVYTPPPGQSMGGSPAGSTILVHANTSILGTLHWPDTLVVTGLLVESVSLRPFQRATPGNLKLVFFYRDRVGRANIEARDIPIPALPTGAERTYPLPLPEARVINVEEFGEVIPPATGEPFKLRIQISNLPGVFDPEQLLLRTWIGNNLAALTSVKDLIAANPGRASFETEIPIAPYLLGHDEYWTRGLPATANAIWLDFTRLPLGHLVTRTHVHVNSVRTNRSAP